MTIQTPVPAKRVSVSNVSLYDVALQYLGDATQWYRIAQANPGIVNGLTAGGCVDPMIRGTVTLTIPPTGKASNGGILD
ncbi:hypothetical protein [Methylosinus sp. PW1]|uniref:hypothetical protein n=1 Tax=Methylosinus sp. PW1 TaxID=107636 RepID=UPI00055F2601|nr:hypothetical protein [Methylosinus sp. PW1]